ncbi:MAG: hypothetical protein UU48_C0009G0036 [Candidatus Uhrbacteria bacterium GW2011_GWF2_41_16]|jgi:hypothetical protein|uniref:Uncharacterized protein n=2 Tax=Candidatus Uhriibacteriota TaxID=1752732 RepID=A0A0G0VA12_9BACT|nr:MAG: hypothetical protein UU35_C0011G0034 [Candidatus Uhrbacteria bacterium GW2011_GWC2_41_11]KKR97764.1 MAG: hypothetical protein UU48_C0009G0036 [Candidatus Uhrbacteria bacterium GW2011_GWF2_41_16]HBO99892.1 hypothetical protein [Candidatus Uhrbacteria bacterium]
MNQPSFFTDAREQFERLAYAYGIQPSVCSLLGEFVHQKLEQTKPIRRQKITKPPKTKMQTRLFS